MSRLFVLDFYQSQASDAQAVVGVEMIMAAQPMCPMAIRLQAAS
jgi:hypothetical protein